MPALFTNKRDERGSYFALVLTEQGSQIEEQHLNGDYINVIGVLINRVRRIYGDDAVFVPLSKMQREVEARRVHTPELLELLRDTGKLYDLDITSYHVYGSPRRALGTWAYIPDGILIQSDKKATGFYSYVAVPRALDLEIAQYDLVFVSHPAIEK